VALTYPRQLFGYPNLAQRPSILEGSTVQPVIGWPPSQNAAGLPAGHPYRSIRPNDRTTGYGLRQKPKASFQIAKDDIYRDLDTGAAIHGFGRLK
jgi:hypothetical protein